jgi:hypothetical protein
VPARLRDIRRVLGEYGVTVEEPSSGSHWLLRRAGSRPYPVPAHRGLNSEIGDQYINALCRHFAIDRSEFKAKL